MFVCLFDCWKVEGRRGEGGGRGFREDGEGRPDTRAFVELCKTTISSKKRLKKNASNSQKRCCFDTTRNCAFRITRREI